MELPLVDVDIALGTPAVPQDAENGYFRTEGEVLAAMDRFGISRGVVRHVFSREYAPGPGNELLDRMESRRLLKCYTLLPAHTGEMGPEDKLVEHLAYRMVRFVTFYPETHHYHFTTHTCGGLLGRLADAEIVVLLDKEQVDYERMYEICRHIPELHLVLTGVAYRDNRDIYPLLADVDNVYIATARFCGMGFIEDMVNRFGPQRLVFSSGMPIYSPGGPITALAYAAIPDDAKRMIAGNNLLSLLGAIDES
jgi:hypothetical protein